MALTYVVVERGNPLNPQEAKKYYARTKASGQVTLKKLGKEIAQGNSALKSNDVLAVLNDFTKVLVQHLAAGEIVRLGDMGAFQFILTGHGAESVEKFNPSHITGGKITFRPGLDLKAALASLKYERIK